MQLFPKLLRIAQSSACALALSGLSLAAAAQSVPNATTWSQVPIVGGGLVSGVVFHPRERGLVYARTDVGGAYRQDAAGGRWVALNDDLGRADAQLSGVLSLAVDARDANRVYLAAGQYTASWGRSAAILRSSDRGATWARIELPFRLGGNEDGRTTGERLQVDPNLGSVMFLGTPLDGLWTSTDTGQTWARVAAIPADSVTFVLFDPASGTAGSRSKTLYAGVNTTTGPSLYRSTDGGASWSAISPLIGLIPHHAGLDARTGDLYVAYGNKLGPNGVTGGAVWKLLGSTGRWIDITPVRPGASSWDTFGYAGLSVDPQNSGTVMVSTLDRWTVGDDIFRSVDGGATWKALRAQAQVDAGNAPWVRFHKDKLSLSHWIGDVDIDPFDANHVIHISGVGLWSSRDVRNADAGQPTHWTFPNDGLEEAVVQELVSPPAGAPLLSALWDVDGFRHAHFSSSPATGMFAPATGHNTSIAFAEANPDIVVRTSTAAATRGFISLDNARTWTAFASAPPQATSVGPGKIAVSADGATLVWMPRGSPAWTSRDRGATWTASQGSPGSAGSNLTPVADRVNPNRFAIYDAPNGRVYTSIDAGARFVANGTLPQSGGAMRAPPGLEGHLWVPTPSALMRSTDFGASFQAVAGVNAAWAVSFGAPAAGQSHPAVFLWGRVGNVEGLFRSDDAGAAWLRINDDMHRWGWTGALAGDPRVHGRVFVGTGGRGIMKGEFSSAAAGTAQSLYADALGSPWQNWSWASVSLSSNSPVHGGSRSIAVTAGAWQALYLHRSAFSTRGLKELVLWVHGGAKGGQPLRLQAIVGGAAQTAYILPAPAAGQWKQAIVPLSALGVAERDNVEGFWLKNSSGATLDTFYVDDISLR